MMIEEDRGKLANFVSFFLIIVVIAGASLALSLIFSFVSIVVGPIFRGYVDKAILENVKVAVGAASWVAFITAISLGCYCIRQKRPLLYGIVEASIGVFLATAAAVQWSVSRFDAAGAEALFSG